MSNIFDDMRAAERDARNTMRAADEVANSMAQILIGRLKHVGTYTLSQLKAELRDFNMHTGDWKK